MRLVTISQSDFWLGGVPQCSLISGVTACVAHLQLCIPHGCSENSRVTMGAACCPVCLSNLLTAQEHSVLHECQTGTMEKEGVSCASLACRVVGISCRFFLPECNMRCVTIERAWPCALLKLSQSPAPCYSCVLQKQNRLW